MTKKKLVSIVLVLIGIVIIVFFGLRAFHAFRRFNGHRPPPAGKVETDVELIRDWMTIPFISRMYQVPAEIIFEAVKISPKENREKSLKDLNHDFYPDQAGYVLELVKSTILANQTLSNPDAPSATTTVSPPAVPTP